MIQLSTVIYSTYDSADYKMSKHKGHKRQKSSLGNVGYHFNEEPVDYQFPKETEVNVPGVGTGVAGAPGGQVGPDPAAQQYHSPQREDLFYYQPYDSAYSYSHTLPQQNVTNVQSNLQSNLQQQNLQSNLLHQNFNVPVPMATPHMTPQHQLTTPQHQLTQPFFNEFQPKFSHKHNNLSISSHFNLFNLQDKKQPPPANTGLVNVTQDPIYHDLINQLNNVDASNINSYLLTILKSLQTTNLPVDDFYNLLYNGDKLINYNQKIDKSLITSNQSDLILNEILNIFKSPNSLIDLFPSFSNKENKLTNINYHELLRTFLAIKILFDMLVELPLDSDKEPQNFTIPRLSIYKTYYILCQKLILTYPSSSNTIGEQQKLILGQSKLGKLIKLVYPDLLIKRLGSRGESKYNYLGVVWNDNIINDEIKNFCEQYDINDLNNLFSDNSRLSTSIQSNSSSPRKHHRKNSSKSKIKLEMPLEFEYPKPDKNTQQQEPGSLIPEKQKRLSQQSIQEEQLISGPKLSFIKPSSKYPVENNFTILSNNEDNWFQEISIQISSQNRQISREIVHQIFLNNDNLLNKDSLLNNMFDLLIKPLDESPHQANIDLKLYLIIIIEILPYLLLIKSSSINITFLKNLRLNLLYLINNFNNEIRKLNSNQFKISTSTIFLIMLKKLININDLLITFIKLIIKDNTKSIMSLDIENFLNMNENHPHTQQTSTSQPTQPDNQDDDSFFFNISSNLGNSTLNDFNFSFKSDILSNDLVYTLIGYNFDPTVSTELKSSISMSFINQEINIIDEFFKKDLLSFLNESGGDILSKPSFEDDATKSSEDSILSSKELSKLLLLINLIDKRLLSSHFKSKYPILIYNNFINFMLNDILKYIFLKQQQLQLQHLQFPNNNQTGHATSAEENPQNSFGNWWVFNSFIQEYISLMGEIVGLYDSL